MSRFFIQYLENMSFPNIVYTYPIRVTVDFTIRSATVYLHGKHPYQSKLAEEVLNDSMLPKVDGSVDSDVFCSFVVYWIFSGDRDAGEEGVG